MPEGDTVFKLARAMAPLLEGKELLRVAIRRREVPELAGRRVSAVDARGKHLLVGLAARSGESELLLRTHLGLRGSWHRYPRAASWKKPSWQASVVLETEEGAFVCFNASEVDCSPRSRAALHPRLGRLGPDLLASPPDLDAVVDRLSRRRDDEAIANVLLDQTIACGVGNVFKSEVLFLTGRLPDTLLGRLSQRERREIYRVASELLSRNVGASLRTTTGTRPGDPRTPKLWVYGRSGAPCLRCGVPIRFARMGRQSRSTYWCPACQA